MLHDIIYRQLFNSWKAVVALPRWLQGFVALSIDVAPLVYLTLLHIQLSEEKWIAYHHENFCKALNPQFPNSFLSRQLNKFFRRLLFLISLQTPISYPLVSTVDNPQQFPFHGASVWAPGFTKHSSTLNMEPQSEQQIVLFLPHSFLALNFWLTLLINIATPDPVGGPSTLQRREWGSECNFSNNVLSYKSLSSTKMQVKQKEKNVKMMYKREKCATYD